MNEQRQQAYFNLIQNLLNCRSEDEVQEILAVNQDLIDAGLVQKMLEMASNLLRQGELDQANRLMNIAGQQLGVSSKLSSTATEKEYLDFLKQVLKVTADSSGNSQVVYSLLAKNTDKLDGVLAEILRRWGTNSLGEVTADEAEYLAAVIVLFSNLIQQFPLGSKASNMEIAITGYEVALIVYTREALPQSWAMTQNNLANAYSNRIKGDRADNIENVIAAFTAALKVYTREALPQSWATTQNNLAIAYSDRIKGDRADNIEIAIAAFTAALKVYTREALPQSWATTQNNLANAYSNRIKGDRADNIEIAIAAYTAALKVRTREALPIDWAMTQNNLAAAYSERIKGDRADNIEIAIAAYTAALKVRTREALPIDWAETLWGLGIAYQNANQFPTAYNTFKSAIATIESLREEIVSGEESKRKQAEQFNKVYSRMVEVCTELNKITEAIEYVERSKTRNLVEQILERDSQTIFPPEVFTQLEKYRDEIDVGQYQIQNGKAENPKDLAQHLQQLRKQRNELQNQYLSVGYGFKFDSFQGSLDDHTAIIEWYILNDKILAFIVTKKGEVTVCQSQPEDQQALYEWVNQYLQNYYGQKDQWQNNLGKALKELASILDIDEILTQIPKHCDKLILIPHRFLHLFPLHAIPVSQNSENSSCLLDLFAGGVSYAPSCQLLQQVQERKRPDFQSLFAIQNPTEDLNYTDLEVQVIQSYFNTSNVLKKTAATLTAINNTDLNTYHCTHFSCHGSFNLTNPGNSALILAEAFIVDTPTKPDSERYLNLRAGETYDLEKCLTLDKIFTLKLEKCRLVTLSACQTGLIDFENTIAFQSKGYFKKFASYLPKKFC
ncbi:MAG: CHAT domain-containing protein [Nostoc indistinguendum CM1-VF10]|nr:CHAT domain-containing protein [Nostoc indistinguendum CM1-VF10]